MSFPSDIAVTTITGQYYLPTGDPADGYLIFTPSAIVKNLANNIVINDSPITVRLVGNGSFSITLPVSQSDLIPNTFLYNVQEIFDGVVVRDWNIRLDESMGASVSLVSLSPAVEPDLSQTYPTLAEVASVAGDLDQVLSARMDTIQAELDTLDTTLTTGVLRTGDIGVTVAPLINGKVPNTMIPPVNVGSVFTVSSQPAMLALTAQRGDIAVRTDTSQTFILNQDDPTILTNWVELLTGAAVTSVNGKVGVVNLNFLDVGAASTTHSHTTLSMTSLVATSGSFTNLTATTSSLVGAAGTNRINMTPSLLEFYDGTTRFFWLDRGSRRLELSNTATLALGPSSDSRVEAAVPSTSTAGTVTTGTWTQNFFAKNASIAGPKYLYTASYDSATTNYTDSTITLQTGNVIAGGVTFSAALSLSESVIDLRSTRVSGSTTNSFLTLDYDGAGAPRAALGATNITFTGSTVLVPDANNKIPATFKGVSGQTANLTEWRNSANALLGAVDPSGVLSLQGNPVPFAVATATVTMSGSGASSYTDTFTWPAGRFTRNPITVITNVGGSGSSGFYIQLSTSATTTGGTVLAVQRDGAVATLSSLTVHILGIQMSSTASIG